jgi:serine/threonine protein kinase
MQGQAMGTPAYMAPEQAAGRLDQIDRRTDVYGLGAILYEILTGRPPFTGTSTVEVLRQVRSHEPEPPSTLAPEVPPALETACLKALAKEPADRFATAGDLGREVQIWEDVERRRAQDDLRQAYDRLMSQQATLVRLTNSKLFQDANLEDIFRELIRAAAETLHVERASLWRFTPDRRAITCTALFERAAGRFSSGMELTAELFPSYFAALDTSDVIAASDAQSDLRTREFTETYLRPLGIGAMMDVPIPPDTMLCNEHVGPPRTWTPDEQMFAIAIAHLAAHAISHWERRVALERLNTRT